MRTPITMLTLNLEEVRKYNVDSESENVNELVRRFSDCYEGGGQKATMKILGRRSHILIEQCSDAPDKNAGTGTYLFTLKTQSSDTGAVLIARFRMSYFDRIQVIAACWGSVLISPVIISIHLSDLRLGELVMLLFVPVFLFPGVYFLFRYWKRWDSEFRNSVFDILDELYPQSI